MPRPRQSNKAPSPPKAPGLPAARSQDHSRPAVAVDRFVAALVHPHKRELLAVREVVMGCDAAIEEGVKWNVPSFWRGEWFATFHLRAKVGLMLILHRGAKVKSAAPARYIEDPDGILQWLANDRGAVTFASMAEVRQKSAALRGVIRRWLDKMDRDGASAASAGAHR